MPLEVIYAPEADKDLDHLFYFILPRSGHRVALAYIERIEAFCKAFSIFPQRGHARDDLSPGLRIVGFERRVTIAFHVEPERVVIDRVRYGGRSLEGSLQPDS